jgi:hypothetical protein
MGTLTIRKIKCRGSTSLKYLRVKQLKLRGWGEGVAQAIACLSGKHKTLISNPSTTKK